MTTTEQPNRADPNATLQEYRQELEAANTALQQAVDARDAAQLAVKTARERRDLAARMVTATENVITPPTRKRRTRDTGPEQPAIEAGDTDETPALEAGDDTQED